MKLDFGDEDKPKGEVTTGFLSKHLGASKKYNENNEGIGYVSPEGYLFGLYRNSLNKPSAYAAKQFMTDRMMLGPLGLQAGLLAGGVTGYGKPLMPMVMPQGVASIGDHSLALGMVPPVRGVTPATLALQYRRRF